MRKRIKFKDIVDAKNFTEAVTNVAELVYLEDRNGQSINAKSFLGVICSMEFDEIWCTCEKDISDIIGGYLYD